MKDSKDKEVSSEEKHLHTLKDGFKDDTKKFQALKSLLKIYNDHPNGKSKLRQLYNTYDTKILSLYLDRISKYVHNHITFSHSALPCLGYRSPRSVGLLD